MAVITPGPSGFLFTFDTDQPHLIVHVTYKHKYTRLAWVIKLKRLCDILFV